MAGFGLEMVLRQQGKEADVLIKYGIIIGGSSWLQVKWWVRRNLALQSGSGSQPTNKRL